MQILAVVVRYKMDIQQSATIRSLCRAFKSRPDLSQSVGLLVWDNSPQPLKEPTLPIPFDYRHSCQNVGVSGAYNRALELAETQGIKWLLLLDQDTTLTDEYLPRLLGYSRALENSEEVAAIAPLLIEGKRIISPMFMRPYRWRHAKPFSRPLSGVCQQKSFAANSGTLMKVSALREAGGYDENFWLDISDVVAFDRLYRKGKRLYVAGDLRLQHRLTNNDYDGSMSPERYRNFVAAEGAYWDSFGTDFQNGLQTARLFSRTIVQYLRYRNKQYSRITGQYFLQRLWTSKNKRILLWKKQALHRELPAIQDGVVIG